MNVDFKASFFTLFHFHTRLFRSSSLSAIRVVSSAYLRLLIFLLEILIPACTSSNRRIIYISVNGAESGDMVIHTELGVELVTAFYTDLDAQHTKVLAHSLTLLLQTSCSFCELAETLQKA